MLRWVTLFFVFLALVETIDEKPFLAPFCLVIPAPRRFYAKVGTTPCISAFTGNTCSWRRHPYPDSVPRLSIQAGEAIQVMIT